MKTLTYKAYCIIEITDDPRKLPNLYTNKREAIESNTSYFGSPCDNPLKRGALCEVEVRVKVPAMPKVTRALLDYTRMTGGKPPILVAGNHQWNASETKRAKAEQCRALKKLHACR